MCGSVQGKEYALLLSTILLGMTPRRINNGGTIFSKNNESRGYMSHLYYVYYLSTSKVVNVGLYKIRLEDSYLSVFTHLTLTL